MDSVITQVQREAPQPRSSAASSPILKATPSSQTDTTTPRRKRKLFTRLFGCFPGCMRAPPEDAGADVPKTGHIRKRSSISRAMAILTGQKSVRNKSALLPPLSKGKMGMKTLVLDLDETLVHSSFKPVQAADYRVPVQIDRHTHEVYVLKRPGVDEFMRLMGEAYEVVIYTASLGKYADQVIDLLDTKNIVSHRLFREACVYYEGGYVKDLNRLGRPLSDVIIIDNSPSSYAFNPENAVPISSWFDDPTDRELPDLVPVLNALAKCEDVMKLIVGTKEEINHLENHNGVTGPAPHSHTPRSPTSINSPHPANNTHLSSNTL